MANESLATCLNDHVAGSVVALELLDHLAEDGAGTAEASTLAGVHVDIEADRQELEAFMVQRGITVSAPRKATGWLVEKLSELKLSLDGLHWVITGGESGARHWRRNPAWVRDVRDRCVAEGVADFHKQWGGRTPEAGGRILDGRTWDELPVPSTPQAQTLPL